MINEYKISSILATVSNSSNNYFFSTYEVRDIGRESWAIYMSISSRSTSRADDIQKRNILLPTSKCQKRFKKCPKHVQAAFDGLLEELEEKGPILPERP